MRLRAGVVAIGAVSPLGRGEDAFDPGRVGEPARSAIDRDREMEDRGFARPFAARVSSALLPASPGSVVDRASALLDLATDACLGDLEAIHPEARRGKIALVLGTSSGGMATAERLFDARARGEAVSAELARGATYFAPFQRCRERVRARGFELSRSLQIVTACAASTWSLGVGLRVLESGEADLVLAGGYDALCTFVASGFESLRATSASRPAPFRLGRDGMALGEGAALVALVREGDVDRSRVRFWVSGFGASTDAVHITAPDRTGAGIARAARAALADAATEPSACGLLSAHCTSTPYNDAMEARAIHDVFAGDGPVVHPFKAQIGHTLGAAGVLETLALGAAVERGIAPAAWGSGPLDPDATVRLLDVAEPIAPCAGLKLSAAFGGANAALVVERRDSTPRALPRSRRPAHLHAVVSASEPDPAAVARASGADVDKVARLDALSLLLATAVARLGREAIEGGGIIVGHGLATIDINERFHARVRERGPTAAEPRLFPPTSPNVMPGQIAILFGLGGPSAAVASGPGSALDPLRLAVDLVAAGDAERVVVAAVDVVGPASRAVLDAGFPEEAALFATGAVAALVSARAEGAIADLSSAIEPKGFGHLALRDALLAIARPEP